MFGQPFVNSVNFFFSALLGLVHDPQHPQHNLMVAAVFFTELVQNGDEDRADCCDYSSDNERPACIHVRKAARTHGKWQAHYFE